MIALLYPVWNSFRWGHWQKSTSGSYSGQLYWILLPMTHAWCLTAVHASFLSSLHPCLSREPSWGTERQPLAYLVCIESLMVREHSSFQAAEYISCKLHFWYLSLTVKSFWDPSLFFCTGVFLFFFLNPRCIAYIDILIMLQIMIKTILKLDMHIWLYGRAQ